MAGEDKIRLRCEVSVDVDLLKSMDKDDALKYRQQILRNMSDAVANLLIADRPDLFTERDNPGALEKTLTFSAAILSEAEFAKLNMTIRSLEAKVRAMDLDYQERQGAQMFEDMLAKRKAAGK